MIHKIINSTKHIIWDWNGTLMNDVDLSVEILNDFLTERGLPLINKQIYQERFCFPVTEGYRRLGFSFKEEPFDVIANAFHHHYEARKQDHGLHHGAWEALQYFEKMGKTQSILSAHRQDLLQEIIKEHNIHRFFTEIIGLRADPGTSKLAIGKDYISRLEHHPEEVVLIGDSLHDWEVASAMGCRCILVANGYYSKERLLEKTPCVVDSIEIFLDSLLSESPLSL